MEKRDFVRLTDDQRAALEGRFTWPLTLRERNPISIAGKLCGDPLVGRESIW